MRTSLHPGIADVSIDLIISNCVVNLSPRKDLVLQAAYRVLKEGGELYFSDVYCDRRLPTEVQRHQVLWGECIAGALYSEVGPTVGLACVPVHARCHCALLFVLLLRVTTPRNKNRTSKMLRARVGSGIRVLCLFQKSTLPRSSSK